MDRTSSDGLSLQDTLDFFFRDEPIDDFKCEKCDRVQVHINRKFNKLPRVLILYLKRHQNEFGTFETESDIFELDQSSKSYKLTKNDCEIKIPKYLTLKYLTCNTSQLQLPKQLSQSLDNEKWKKKLLYDDTRPETSLPPYKIPLKEQKPNNLGLSQCDQLLKSKHNVTENNETTAKPVVYKSSSVLKSPLVVSKPGPLMSKPEMARPSYSSFGDFDELPDLLPSNDVELDFDPKHFRIENMTDEEQLKIALELSLNAEKTGNEITYGEKLEQKVQTNTALKPRQVLSENGSNMRALKSDQENRLKNRTPKQNENFNFGYLDGACDPLGSFSDLEFDENKNESDKDSDIINNEFSRGPRKRNYFTLFKFEN